MPDETHDLTEQKFPYRDPCGVCGEAGIELLCWACRERLHGRCCKTHYDRHCPAPWNFRHANPDGRSPLEVDAAVGEHRDHMPVRVPGGAGNSADAALGRAPKPPKETP